jgi:hypothetical protein
MFAGLSFVHWLVVLSALVSIAGSAAYIRDTLSGKTKPNRVSFSMWALAPLIGTAAALSAHADVWATIRIFLSGFLPLLIFLASFINPQSYWKLSIFDLLCGLFSLIALSYGLLLILPALQYSLQQLEMDSRHSPPSVKRGIIPKLKPDGHTSPVS